MLSVQRLGLGVCTGPTWATRRNYNALEGALKDPIPLERFQIATRDIDIRVQRLARFAVIQKRVQGFRRQRRRCTPTMNLPDLPAHPLPINLERLLRTERDRVEVHTFVGMAY